MKKKPLFCPKCHKRLVPPEMLYQGNIKITGSIKLNCGDPKCKGVLKLKGNADEQKELHTTECSNLGGDENKECTPTEE